MRPDPSRARLFVLLASFLFLAPAWSQEPGVGPVLSGPVRPVAAEPPLSIFNDQLRRFKFQLEHDVATWETAEAFLLRYQRPNNPPIVGAYPDADSNSLIIIGKPESEQAIRESLAEWMVESQSLGPARALAMQLRILQHERAKLLQQMAGVEVSQVKAAASEDEKAKVPQLAHRLQHFERELKVVEEQMQVVRKYIDRLEDGEPAATNRSPVSAAP
jgi:hypothetical protein